MGSIPEEITNTFAMFLYPFTPNTFQKHLSSVGVREYEKLTKFRGIIKTSV